MTLFNQTVPVDDAVIARLVLAYWGVVLGERLKASQNHTYKGTLLASNEKGEGVPSAVSVRVTPSDASRSHLARIVDEVSFVRYVATHADGPRHVCTPLPMAKETTDDADIADTEGGTVTLYASLLEGDRSQRHVLFYAASVQYYIVIVSEWAIGAPVNMLDFKSWMAVDGPVAATVDGDDIASTRPPLAFIWGQWLGRLHHVSRAFGVDYAVIASRIQSWDALHSRVMALRGTHCDYSAHTDDPSYSSSPEWVGLHGDDVAMMSSAADYGVLHGDLNLGNFYFATTRGHLNQIDAAVAGMRKGDAAAHHHQHGGATLSVYDWDQVQRGWYMYDVAQSAFFVYFLEEAGNPFVPRKEGEEGIVAVPEADPIAFSKVMLDGYEQWRGGAPGVDVACVKVDRAHFERMVKLRIDFYETFCRQAFVEELGVGAEEAKGTPIPPDMRGFLAFVVKWCDQRRKKAKETCSSV